MVNKIEIKEIEEMIKKAEIEIGQIKGKKIIFNPNISCEKIFAFCEQTSNAIFNPEGLYIPKLKDILIFAFMLENMTNIKIKKDENGNIDIDFIYSLMRSEIGKKISQKFKTDITYYFLVQEIKGIVSYKKDLYLKKVSPQNKTLENIDNLIEELSETAGKISNFAEEQNKVVTNEKLDKIIKIFDKVKKENES